MTTAGIDVAQEADRRLPAGPGWFASDCAAEAQRHLIATVRNPDLLMFATIQPIMFVVLFVYVFGGSITVPGGDYVQFVVPGIFAQTVVFGSAFTGIGVAEDMAKGFMDRLRTLPMYPPAVLMGRTLSDLARNVFTFTIMLIVGLLVGFRLQGGLTDALVATVLLLAFAYAFSWIQAWVGLSVKSVEAASSAGMIWMFPMTFLSSAFVDPSTMPGWLQPVANANPFTVVTNATRALYNGYDPGNDVWYSILWAVGITVVFGFLALRKFASQSR
ncbi:MAG: ABC transporter permease [Acidimicrobiia bacterium]|nr:ABC transporter permease [Acidimicrobiia bacterium]